MLSRDALTAFRYVAILSLSAFAGLTCKPTPVATVPVTQLDGKITVLDHDPNPSDNKVAITVQFFSAGNFVKLGAGASVTANGVNLPFQSIAYLDRVAMVGPAGTYSIVHNLAGVSTPVATITVPQRPAISSPGAGALIPRSNSVMINYVAGSGSHVSGRAAGHKALSGTVSVEANDQPDDGSYGPLDSTGFDAGSGSVSLTRTLISSPPGTGLNSVQVTYHSGTRRTVTWQ